jgi:hypothetical protein
MALSILDGNQSATTLSTILSSGQHITAHTVVSLGTQAITDIVNATSAGLTNTQLRASAVTIGGTVTVGNSLTISSLPAISGTVTANVFGKSGSNDGTLYQIPVNESGNSDVLQRNIPIGFIDSEGISQIVKTDTALPIQGTVTIGSALPAGTNRIGVVTIGAGTVTIGAGTAQIGSVTVGNSVTISSLPNDLYITIRNGLVNYNENESPFPVSVNYAEPITGTVTLGAGTAQIGSVTASISGTVPISISSVTVGNSVTIGSLPAISGTVTANTFALQGTAVTTSNFTSTTASTVLASFNATREVLTIFNEGAGNLHICAGATCTTIAYQVRLSAGDYYEVPNHQTTITHSAVFATAGTARVTEVS